jgi:hypothetical protein
LLARIDKWGKAGQKWAEAGQVLAMSCLKHLSDHGDVGFVNRLFLAMPKGTKSSAMGSWLLTHGALVANTDKGSKTAMPFKYDKSKVTDLEAAAKDPWYDHKPEPDADQIFDLQKALEAIIKKAGKAKQVAHGELLEGVAALLGVDAPMLAEQAEEEVGEAPF